MKWTRKELEFVLEACRNAVGTTDVKTFRDAVGKLQRELDLREDIGRKSQAALRDK